MAEKTKAPSKNHKWDAKNKRWVLKTFEERQKGRNILLQGKNNPIRVVHDTIRNVNAAKEVRKKDSLKTNNKSNNTKSKGSSKDQDDARKEAELSTYLKKKPKGGYSKSNTKDPGPGKTTGKKKKMHAIERRNREIHGDTKVQALKDRHAAWKKARKEGTLAEWEKEHHPNRKPQYSKKTKLKVKGDTQGKSMPSNPKGMRQEGVGKTAKDLTRHKTGSSITKKKKKKNLTKNEIKYPKRGTFRGI